MNKSSKSSFRSRAFLMAAAVLGAGLQAAPLPTGGSVTAGAATIATTGSTLNVTQTTAKAAINWDSFSVGQGNAVRFVQPSASSVALNRVTGSEVSTIQGSLTANGQVFLLNPNGVLFTRTAQVNVGGIVATTLGLSDADFLAGNYRFAGVSTNAVVNEGNLTAVSDGRGGYVAMIAAKVINDGEISAERGAVLLGAGSQVRLDLGGVVGLTVEQGVLDALVANGGAIRANGGQVLLTARSAADLPSTVVNHTGLIEAQTLATGEQGEVRLLGAGPNDGVAVSGKLDVSAPRGGNGGFIETSGGLVSIADSAVIDASAPTGHVGNWLLDPTYINIIASGGVSVATAQGQATGTADISVTSLASALNSADVTLEAANQIDFQTAFTFTGTRNASLTLLAPTVKLGGNITATGTKLNLTFGGVSGANTYAGNVFLYNPAGVALITRTLTTNGGNVYFKGDIGGAQAFVVDAGTGDVRMGATVNGTFTCGQQVYGDLAFRYQAGGRVGDTTTINFTNSTVSFDDGVSIYQANQSELTAISGRPFSFPTGYLVIPAGAVMDLNAQRVPIILTHPDGTTDISLQSANNGQVTFPSVPTPVARIEFTQTNGSWTEILAVGISWVTTVAAGKVQNLTIKSGTTTIDAGKTLNVNGDIRVSTAKFVNSSGPSALSAGTGKTWQVWSTNPAPFDPTTGDVSGSLPYDFKQYGATYGSSAVLGTGNGMFYSYIPPISVNLINTITKVYDGNTNATNLTNSNYQLNTGAVAGDVVTLTGTMPTTGQYADKNVNTGISVTSSIIPTSNFSAISNTGKPVYGYGLNQPTATGNIGIITKKTLTSLTGITANDRYYNQLTGATLNLGGASFGGKVTGDTLTVTSATGTFLDKNSANGKTVNITNIVLGGADAGNYNLPAGPFTTTASIWKLDITAVTGITANDKVYDGNTTATLNTGSAGFTGLLSGDTLTVGAATGNFVDKNVGNGKTVNITGLTLSGLDAINYNLTATTATTTASITKLRLSALTGITANDRPYDQGTSATLNLGGAGFTGKVAGDTLTITSATGTFSDKNAANGKTVTLSNIVLGGLDAQNYDLPTTPTTTTANITKLDITAVTGITANDKTYDRTTAATLNTGSAGFTGLLTGDTLTVSAATGNFVDKNAGNGKTVNITGLVIGGLDAVNYNLTASTATTTASIFKIDITAITGITANDKVYDGNTTATLSTGSAGFTGLLTGDTLTVSAATGDFVDKNAGNGKTVNITGLTLTGLDAINYNLTATTATTTASITKLRLSALTGITANDRPYDQGTSATLNLGGAGFTGKVAGDTLTITSAIGTFSDKNAANGKTVTLSNIVLGGLDAQNYDLPTTPTTTTASITKLDITAVTGVTAYDKYYDGNTSATLDTSSAGFTGLLTGDTLTVSAATGDFVDKNAGNGKTVNITGLVIGGLDAVNYNLISSNATTTASIFKLRLSAITGVTADNKVYDGGTTASVNTSGAVFGGKVAGDTLSLTAGGNFTDANGGNAKTVNLLNVVLAGLDAQNYELPLSLPAPTANITPAPLTVQLGSHRTTASSTPYPGPYTYTFSGFVNGELPGALSGTLIYGGPASTATTAGTYVVTGSGLTSGNYAITFLPGTLILDPAATPVDPHLYLPVVTVVPVFPAVTPVVLAPTPVAPVAPNAPAIPGPDAGQRTVAVGGLNYVPMTAAEANQANRNSEQGISKYSDVVKANRERVDNGNITRSLHGATDIFVIDGGLNLGKGNPSAQ